MQTCKNARVDVKTGFVLVWFVFLTCLPHSQYL